MRIGYACLAIGVTGTSFKSCTLKHATQEKLVEITSSNLDALGALLTYNQECGIRLFRISSDIIPFGSHPAISFDWDIRFQDQLTFLGEKARSADIRLSLHPGQYTVLNSPDPNVVERAIADLRYHCRLLDLLRADSSAKMILHVGGAYGNKQAALERFAVNYRNLDDDIRRRLVLENDDRIFTIEDVLDLGLSLRCPVVFDNLHNEVNPSDTGMSESAWISACTQTWRHEDGAPKTHYSQQAQDKRLGSHSRTIDADAFLAYLSNIHDDVDVMLEVKDKNLSAVKCLLCSSSQGKINDLEKEWARYKYLVLEHSPQAYSAIRALLKNKSAYPALAFYRHIDAALAQTPEIGMRVNAAQHVWGYFSGKATEKEKARFDALMGKYIAGTGSIDAVKRHLFKLSQHYREEYLMQSYYFFMD